MGLIIQTIMLKSTVEIVVRISDTFDSYFYGLISVFASVPLFFCCLYVIIEIKGTVKSVFFLLRLKEHALFHFY